MLKEFNKNHFCCKQTNLGYEAESKEYTQNIRVATGKISPPTTVCLLFFFFFFAAHTFMCTV